MEYNFSAQNLFSPLQWLNPCASSGRFVKRNRKRDPCFTVLGVPVRRTTVSGNCVDSAWAASETRKKLFGK